MAERRKDLQDDVARIIDRSEGRAAARGGNIATEYNQYIGDQFGDDYRLSASDVAKVNAQIDALFRSIFNI